MFPSVAIDAYVPESVRKDVRRVASSLISKGSSVLIQVPAEDFCGVMNDLAPQVGYPFVPTLCGLPVNAWERTYIGFITSKKEDKTPTILDVYGKEYDITEL